MPRTSTTPDVGRDSPRRMRNKVVLPAPLAPTTPMRPAGTSADNESSAVTCPYRFVTSWRCSRGAGVTGEVCQVVRGRRDRRPQQFQRDSNPASRFADRSPIEVAHGVAMNATPDLTHFFAIHRKMRIDTRRYALAVESAVPADRGGRLEPLARWAKGFAHELDEHHYAEDTYFFPELRERIPSAGAALDQLDADHRVVDDILSRWSPAAERLADPSAPFADAQAEAVELATGLRDLLQRHLEIEDRDILPLYWRHYSAADFDALHQQAVKGGKKKGLAFVVPWNVYS